MRHTLALVVLTLALPAAASEPGQPLDCSDWEFFEEGLFCTTFDVELEPESWVQGGPVLTNTGELLTLRTSFLEGCGGVHSTRIEVWAQRHGTADRVLARIDGGRPASGFDSCDHISFPPWVDVRPLLFDATNGRLLIPLYSQCFGSECSESYGGGEWVAAIEGFATLFEILQTFEPARAAFSFRVPYMPEGFEAADRFDAYYGDLATLGDYSAAQPLQCDFPQNATVGDPLTVNDLPTPPVGHGYYFVTAVHFMGQRRYGRQRLEGMLSARNPGLLPACSTTQ